MRTALCLHGLQRTLMQSAPSFSASTAVARDHYKTEAESQGRQWKPSMALPRVEAAA
jgi:hypothetical protein